MRISTFFLLVLWLLVACQGERPQPAASTAEGWVSSGGELLRDTQNPWWVRNTSEVKYCIKIDEASFSGSPEIVRKAVQDAFTYWQNEFRKRSTNRNPSFQFSYHDATLYGSPKTAEGNWLGVGMQTFVERPCDEATLFLQFGYGTMDAQQLQFIREPKRYIALTIRTDYDRINLRGRGFIVVGSDRGPSSMVTPQSGIQVHEPWTSGAMLMAVLVHEFGHLFGISHVGDAGSPMSERFPDLLMTAVKDTSVSRGLSDVKMMRSFFSPLVDNVRCGRDDKMQEAWNFLGLEWPKNVSPRDTLSPCLEIRFTADERQMQIVGRDEKNVSVGIGSIQDLNLTYTFHSALSLEIPPEQTVFTAEEVGSISTINARHFIFGPSLILAAHGSGKYIGPNGVEKPIYLRAQGLTHNMISLMGIIDQKFKTFFSEDTFTF